MRLIDANKLGELCDIMADTCDGMGASIWNQFKAMVVMSPTIDAVPVVRCKDCKHTLRSKDGKIVCCLTKMVGTTYPDWFCADGEAGGERWLI